MNRYFSLMLPSPAYEDRFSKISEFESGGTIHVHNSVSFGNTEFAENYFVAVVKAKAGCRVDILPVLTERDPERQLIYYDAKLNKNPDLRINGTLYEVEHPDNPEKLNTLRNRIKEGARQADYLIIILNMQIGINLMRRACKGKFIDFSNLKRVEYLYKETSFVFNREDFHYDKNEPIL